MAVPNVADAQLKKEQAEELEKKARDIKDIGETDRASRIVSEAKDLADEADQEMIDAQRAAEIEKAKIDDTYGTG